MKVSSRQDFQFIGVRIYKSSMQANDLLILIYCSHFIQTKDSIIFTIVYIIICIFILQSRRWQLWPSFSDLPADVYYARLNSRSVCPERDHNCG